MSLGVHHYNDFGALSCGCTLLFATSASKCTLVGCMVSLVYVHQSACTLISAFCA